MSFKQDQPENEIDRELESLSSRAGELIASCRCRSCFDSFGELRTTAEREGRALYYIHGTFFQMTQASNLLDFQTARERAIKLISLLQKPEECFKIQPDLPEDLYEFLVHDLSSCVYENLADAAGQMGGFNSKGLHDSIAGGIQICRNTGKIGCIQCFREYAGDVYLAADDADLARHQCQTVIDHDGAWQSRGNRRWLAMMKLGWIEATQGAFELALQKTQAALELTEEEEVNVPLHAKFDVLVQLDSLRMALGQKPQLKQHEIYLQLPARDECPVFCLMLDQNDAMEAALEGDYGRADEILSSWDQRLFGLGARHLWFENRLRLIALRHLSGKFESINSLASVLEEKASEADDWLTIRRLGEILGGSQPPGLLGIAARETIQRPVSSSNRNPGQPRAKTGEQGEKENGKNQTSVLPFGAEDTKLNGILERLVERLKTAYDDRSENELAAILEELLGFTPEESPTNADTCGLLNLMTMLVSPLFVERYEQIWKWSNRIAAPFRDSGVVLSLLATIGNEIRLAGDDPEEGFVTAARIEQLFRKSLELEKNGPQTYARAGTFFLDQEDLGEAEKCFARGFKLDRKAANIALKLAEVYNLTDRPRDALHILDLCLREGSESDSVAWEAMLSAFQQRQFESMLIYLDRYEEFVGSISPINFYRGIALLELKQAEKALEAIDREKEFCVSGKDFHCGLIEYCALVELGEGVNQNGLAEKCLNVPLRKLDYLSITDILFLFERFWLSIGQERKDSSFFEELENKMLAAGIMPDAYFEELRSGEKPVDNIRFFRVLLSQQLGDSWGMHEGCLPGQEEWQNYYCEWGVLSLTEEDARERVIEMQGRCYGGYSEVVEVIEDDQLFVDRPGVVWQGGRYSIPEDLDLEDDSTDGDFGDDDFGDDDFGDDDFDRNDSQSGGG